MLTLDHLKCFGHFPQQCYYNGWCDSRNVIIVAVVSVIVVLVVSMMMMMIIGGGGGGDINNCGVVVFPRFGINNMTAVNFA